MNWNLFKRRDKVEKPKSVTPLQKALEINEIQKAYTPNRQLRRMSKRLKGNKHTGRMP